MASGTVKRTLKNKTKLEEVSITNAFSRLISRVALGEISSSAVGPILQSLQRKLEGPSSNLESTRQDLQMMVGRLRSSLSDLAAAVNGL